MTHADPRTCHPERHRKGSGCHGGEILRAYPQDDIRRRGAVVFACLQLCISGCAHQIAKTPTTAPLVLNMSDSKDLQKLLRADEQPNLTHKLTLWRTGLIYFGALETSDDDEQIVTSAPIILRKANGHWRGIRISDPRLKNASWAYVGAGP